MAPAGGSDRSFLLFVVSAGCYTCISVSAHGKAGAVLFLLNVSKGWKRIFIHASGPWQIVYAYWSIRNARMPRHCSDRIRTEISADSFYEPGKEPGKPIIRLVSWPQPKEARGVTPTEAFHHLTREQRQDVVDQSPSVVTAACPIVSQSEPYSSRPWSTGLPLNMWLRKAQVAACSSGSLSSANSVLV